LVDTRCTANRWCLRPGIMDGMVERESCRWEMGCAKKTRLWMPGELSSELACSMHIFLGYVLRRVLRSLFCETKPEICDGEETTGSTLEGTR
jgi:hypothetical protein